MWKKLTETISARKKSTVQQLAQSWETFRNFHAQTCEEDPPSPRKKRMRNLSGLQSLDKILQLLIEEQKQFQDSGNLPPCLEFCFTEQVLDELAANAQTDKPPGLLAKIVEIFTYLIANVKTDLLFPHRSFICAVTGLMHVIYSNLLEGKEFYSSKPKILNLVKVLLEKIVAEESLLVLFIYEENKKEEFLPMKLLMTYFHEEDMSGYTDLAKAMCQINKIPVKSLLTSVCNDFELALCVNSKLAFYYQRLSVYPEKNYLEMEQFPSQLKALKDYSEFFNKFCLSCESKELKQDIVYYFYEDFCVQVLTPKLQSYDKKTRSTSTEYLCEFLEHVHDKDILLTFVHFLLGKDKDGNKRLSSLVSTPTNSTVVSLPSEGKFTSQGVFLSDISKMWQVLFSNLSCTTESLSVNTLRLLDILFSKKVPQIVKLLVTNHFVGPPLSSEFGINTESFMSLFPVSVLDKTTNNYYGEYLEGAFSGVYEAMESLTRHSQEPENTGGSYSVLGSLNKQDGGTGGTSRKKLSLTIKLEDESFFEGQLLETIFAKFRNFFSNTFEENIYLTGIASSLCTFPQFGDLGFSNLHSLLLEPQPGVTESFISILKVLSYEVDNKTVKDTAFLTKLQAAQNNLDLPLKQKKGFNIIQSIIAQRNHRRKTHNQTFTNFTEKKFLEGVVVLQEFLKELGAILIYKEILADMHQTSLIL